MTVGIELDNIIDEVGAPDFFYAFFSTISGNLEPNGWGSRFPILMKKLYNGEVLQVDADKALSELRQATSELKHLSPDRVIWDFEDRKKSPPWGKNISNHITNLSNYFVTSTGRDLVGCLDEIFTELREKGEVAKVVSI